MQLVFDNTVPPAAVLAAVQGSLSGLRVWLDDDLVDRAAPKGWVHVTTAFQANVLVDTGAVVELSLDNDLGDDERYGQGKAVIDFICERQMVDGRDLWPREGLALHTANSAARQSMTLTVMRFAPEVCSVEQGYTPGGKPRFSFS
jgi:hypothetical protein